jgi:hypothetical protein
MRDLALAATPRFPICVAQEETNTSHVTSGPKGAASLSAIHEDMLPFAAAGTNGGCGDLTTVTFHVTGSTVGLSAYDTSYTFGVGRILVALSVDTFGEPAPTPLAGLAAAITAYRRAPRRGAGSSATLPGASRRAHA